MCTKCSNEKCTANSLHFETIFDGNSFIFMVPLIKGYHSPTSRLCNWLLVSRFLQALNLFHPVFTAKIILIPTTSLLKAGKYLHRECTETHTHTHTHTRIYIYIYRVSQEECARLRESVPYVKVYRYNPKHQCPNLNGYGDNGQRKVWSSCGSTYCTWFA